MLTKGVVYPPPPPPPVFDDPFPPFCFIYPPVPPLLLPYIDELDEYEFTRLQEKNVVGVDPGLNDLIYCVNGDQKDTISKFRYSQNQRRQETKSKKYRDLTREWKKEIVGHQDVIRWETELSHYNKKTLDFGRFQDYIEKKNNMNFNLQDFYHKYIFRKLKLGGTCDDRRRNR